jgi:hypothetical protein
MAPNKSAAYRKVSIADRLQVIPLDLLIEPPPPRSRRPEVETLLLYWRTVRSLPGRFQAWQWCLGVTLCQALVGSILLVCLSDLGAVSRFLAFTQLIPVGMYSFLLLLPANRKQALMSLSGTYVSWGVLVLTFTFLLIFS